MSNGDFITSSQKYNILAAEWFCNGYNNIGAVAIQSVDSHWKCYIGQVEGNDEEVDKQSIARDGVKLPKAVAVALFPGLDPEKWIN